MLLNNIEIKNAQLKDKEYVMSDGSGLVILIKPSGAKLWRYRYSMPKYKSCLWVHIQRYHSLRLEYERLMLAPK